MVLLLSSNAETSIIKRGFFFFKGGKKSSRGTLTALLLVASLCFVDVTEGILESCMSRLNIVILKQNHRRQAIREFLSMFCVRTFFCTTLHIF